MAWRRFFSSARMRILAWLAVLIALSMFASILAIRQILLAQLQKRVERSLAQEAKEVSRLVEGRNPATGQPFEDVYAIFDVFLSRNVPGDNEILIAVLNGKIYKSSPIALPNSLRQDPDMIRYWGQLTKTEKGQKVTPTETILYLAQPLKTRGEDKGVFVVANSITEEWREVNQAVFVAAQVIITVLVIAFVLAWIVAGRVLAPLQMLTEAARSITDLNQNQNQRIPVKGSDEIAELTATFNEMLERLQASFSSQRDFINDASHELQTPITVIQGHLETLSDDPQQRRASLELVTDELNRMSRLVADLLLLARAERPDFLTLELVEVSKLTEELYAKAMALASRKWCLESKASIRIVADRQRLTQIMMNLIQNAVAHTTEGDLIEIGSRLVGEHIHFWVRDTGTGIASADQERIFKRFARASNNRRRSGAGLGLSIVQAIAQAHGGWVEVLSSPGAGATFTIVIPLEPPQEVVSHEPDSDRRRRTPHRRFPEKRSRG